MERDYPEMLELLRKIAKGRRFRVFGTVGGQTVDLTIHPVEGEEEK